MWCEKRKDTKGVGYKTDKLFQQCSVRLDLQLFVAGLESYLRYLCLLAYGVVFLFCLSSSCAPYGASFFLDCPFLIAPSLFSKV